jgi:D,D-heptose 1,7-bisphosphate phosphatase
MAHGEPTRQAAILVGGFGTRLGALTQACPKPLLGIQGEPFLARLMSHLLRFGFNDFVLLAGYLADQVTAFARDYADRHSVSVRVSVELDPAGTGGALKIAGKLLDEEFILLNGDTMFNFNLLDLGTRAIDFDWIGRLALRHVPDTSRYGRVDHTAGRITGMREKAPGSGAGAINAGVYWLRREIVDHIGSLPCSLETDVFPRLIADGVLAGFAYEGAFIDIGVPEDLDRAKKSWRDYVARPAVFFDRDGVLNHDAGYTHRPEEFRWTDAAIATIKACNDADCFVFVVTNQAGVARGLYNEEDVRRLHHWMNAELRRYGAHVDAFAYCPHHPDGVITELAITCDCRKPQPGMIRDLMTAWPVVPKGTFLVGDKASDVEAAGRAGIPGLLVAHGGSNLREFVIRRLAVTRAS